MVSIDEAWKTFLKQIMTDGEIHTKDDGDKLKEILINHCFIDNPVKHYTINLNIFLNMIQKGLLDIPEYPIKGIALYNYVSSYNDSKQIFIDENPESFVYTYPERLKNIKLSDREQNTNYFNQIEIITERLKKHYGSNRAVATLYSAGLDGTEKDIPCLQWLQATIRNNQLVLHVMFRSNDCFGAFPSNMLFLTYIGLSITASLKQNYPLIEFKGINYNSTSLHVYEADWDKCEKIVKNLKE